MRILIITTLDNVGDRDGKINMAVDLTKKSFEKQTTTAGNKNTNPNVIRIQSRSDVGEQHEYFLYDRKYPLTKVELQDGPLMLGYIISIKHIDVILVCNFEDSRVDPFKFISKNIGACGAFVGTMTKMIIGISNIKFPLHPKDSDDSEFLELYNYAIGDKDYSPTTIEDEIIEADDAVGSDNDEDFDFEKFAEDNDTKIPSGNDGDFDFAKFGDDEDVSTDAPDGRAKEKYLYYLKHEEYPNAYLTDLRFFSYVENGRCQIDFLTTGNNNIISGHAYMRKARSDGILFETTVSHFDSNQQRDQICKCVRPYVEINDVLMDLDLINIYKKTLEIGVIRIITVDSNGVISLSLFPCLLDSRTEQGMLQLKQTDLTKRIASTVNFGFVANSTDNEIQVHWRFLYSYMMLAYYIKEFSGKQGCIEQYEAMVLYEKYFGEWIAMKFTKPLHGTGTLTIHNLSNAITKTSSALRNVSDKAMHDMYMLFRKGIESVLKNAAIGDNDYSYYLFDMYYANSVSKLVKNTISMDVQISGRIVKKTMDQLNDLIKKLKNPNNQVKTLEKHLSYIYLICPLVDDGLTAGRPCFDLINMYITTL